MYLTTNAPCYGPRVTNNTSKWGLSKPRYSNSRFSSIIPPHDRERTTFNKRSDNHCALPACLAVVTTPSSYVCMYVRDTKERTRGDQHRLHQQTACMLRCVVQDAYLTSIASCCSHRQRRGRGTRTARPDQLAPRFLVERAQKVQGRIQNRREANAHT